jgi:ABC-type antimicrobial peptide transport system permease subunit
LIGWLLGFAVLVLGLLLASLGIYGVISGFAARRANEIGVRMALGARFRDIIWLVMGQGLRLTLIGIAIGFAGAFGITRLLASVSPALLYAPFCHLPACVCGYAGLLDTGMARRTNKPHVGPA